MELGKNWEEKEKKLNIWRNILLEYILGFIIYLIVKKKKGREMGIEFYIIENEQQECQHSSVLLFLSLPSVFNHRFIQNNT